MEDTEESRKLNFNTPKIKNEKFLKRLKYDLNGLKILMVGMSAREQEFRDFVKENGGILHVHDKGSGRKWENGLKNLIEKFDVVIICLRQVSHSQSKAAINFSKELNKPFESLKNYGKHSLIESIKSALQKGDGSHGKENLFA